MNSVATRVGGVAATHTLSALDRTGADDGRAAGATSRVRQVGAWREVSVNGAMRAHIRPRMTAAGQRVPTNNAHDDSRLTNGTVIDLGGIPLLFESAEAMAAPGRVEPKEIMDDFNARRPQCPVQMHTIRIEYDSERRDATPSDRRPYIFPACGHVHAYAPELVGRPCPLCRTSGPFVELKLEWEPAICKEKPDVVFNPCGHIASAACAEQWSRFALPDNAPPQPTYRPVCPFCAKPLAAERPYSRILFSVEDDEEEDEDDEDDDEEEEGFGEHPGSVRLG